MRTIETELESSDAIATLTVKVLIAILAHEQPIVAVLHGTNTA